MSVPSVTCPNCRRSLTVTTARCPKCGFTLLELPPVEDRAPWRWQARTTAFAILIAIVFGVLAIWAVLMLVDSYEEKHGIESHNGSYREHART